MTICTCVVRVCPATPRDQAAHRARPPHVPQAQKPPAARRASGVLNSCALWSCAVWLHLYIYKKNTLIFSLFYCARARGLCPVLYIYIDTHGKFWLIFFLILLYTVSTTEVEKGFESYVNGAFSYRIRHSSLYPPTPWELPLFLRTCGPGSSCRERACRERLTWD